MVGQGDEAGVLESFDARHGQQAVLEHAACQRHGGDAPLRPDPLGDRGDQVDDGEVERRGDVGHRTIAA